MNKKDLNRTKLSLTPTGHNVILGHQTFDGKPTELQRIITDEFIDTMVKFLDNKTAGGVRPLILSDNGVPKIQITIGIIEGATPAVIKATEPKKTGIKTF